MMIDQGSPNGSRNGKKRGSNRRLFGAPTTERVKKVEFVIGWVSVDEKGRAATEGIVLDRDVWYVFLYRIRLSSPLWQMYSFCFRQVQAPSSRHLPSTMCPPNILPTVLSDYR